MSKKIDDINWVRNNWNQIISRERWKEVPWEEVTEEDMLQRIPGATTYPASWLPTWIDFVPEKCRKQIITERLLTLNQNEDQNKRGQTILHNAVMSQDVMKLPKESLTLKALAVHNGHHRAINFLSTRPVEHIDKALKFLLSCPAFQNKSILKAKKTFVKEVLKGLDLLIKDELGQIGKTKINKSIEDNLKLLREKLVNGLSKKELRQEEEISM